jgi:LysM repeat protein
MSTAKMRIVAFKDRKFTSEVSNYQVMINPDTIKLNRSIKYNTEQVPDSSEPSIKYQMTPASTLSFDLTLDCTGVVDAKRFDLPQEIKQLLDVVYDYHGDIHRPNFVQISWGVSETFQGVLSSFDTSYTLFKPDGTPLRAKISLSFTSYLDPTTLAKKENTSSPDLTHLVDVVLGDSLPGLSKKIYNTPDYYVQLAQFNGLDKFRQLQPGTRLIFPPVVTQGTIQ